jgi:hypothetical protein
MLDLICELTRQRLPTPDIRARVQLLFADIPWNERRFYNRLSEERQKQRVRDAEARVQQLHGLWSNVVAAAAGSQELTEIAQADIHRMVDKLCSMAQTDASTLPLPLVQQPSSSDHDHLEDLYDVGGQASSQDAMDTTGDSSSQDEVSQVNHFLRTVLTILAMCVFLVYQQTNDFFFTETWQQISKCRYTKGIHSSNDSSTSSVCQTSCTSSPPRRATASPSTIKVFGILRRLYRLWRRLLHILY